MHLWEDREHTSQHNYTTSQKHCRLRGGKWFSLMYLCLVSLSSHDWPAQKQSGVLQNRGQGECECVHVRQQENEGAGRGERVCQWQGSQIKGRKAPFPQLNVPQGGVREGERTRKERERLWTDNTPARLQIYSYQALRALPCLFLQPVKTNCSHVSITHILFLLIRSGQAFGCCIISLSITPE